MDATLRFPYAGASRPHRGCKSPVFSGLPEPLALVGFRFLAPNKDNKNHYSQFFFPGVKYRPLVWLKALPDSRDTSHG